MPLAAQRIFGWNIDRTSSRGRRMDLLSVLSVASRVVETGSFSAVARERNINQAAIARQISQLEAHFGVRLFHRTTRKLSLTDDGATLMEYARAVLDDVEGMESALNRHRSSAVGIVRVGVSVAASYLLASRLPALTARHPDLKVELVVSDGFSDMILERLDLALRAGEIADASLVTRSAGTVMPVAVAAPKYAEVCGIPAHPSQLTEHACLVHDTGPNSDHWEFITSEGCKRIRVPGRFAANNSGTILLAARAGHGIAFLPCAQVFDDLRTGALVRILSEFPVPTVPISLVYPSRRHLAPRTRVVMDFVVEQIREMQQAMAENEVPVKPAIASRNLSLASSVVDRGRRPVLASRSA
jgi:DNA-binding transcriptional LysR family regulator